MVGRLGIAVLALGLVACSSEQPSVNEEVAAIERGQVSYELYCALCHGALGQGYVSPKANALTNEDFLISSTDEFLFVGIEQGRTETKMSSYGRDYLGPMDDEEIYEIIAYLRSYQTEETLSLDESWQALGDVDNGAILYASQCAGCHGADLKGNSALSLNNPVFLRTASDAFLRYALEKGRRGTAMPAFESQLSAQEIEDLIVFIRSTEEEVDETPVVVDDPRETCPDITYVGDGDAPVGFDVAGDDFLLGIDAIYPEYERGAKFILVDARPPADYNLHTIVGAISIPYYDMPACADTIPEDAWVVTFCACPHDESVAAAEYLTEAGHEKVVVMDEGYIVWRLERGYPTTD